MGGAPVHPPGDVPVFVAGGVDPGIESLKRSLRQQDSTNPLRIRLQVVGGDPFAIGHEIHQNPDAGQRSPGIGRNHFKSECFPADRCRR